MSHAIRVFNALACETDRIPDAAIEAMGRGRKVPPELGPAAADPLYASKPVLLRRTSGATRLTVFDGGHDILHEAALTWLEAQRHGKSAVWTTKPHEPRALNAPAAAAGR